MSGLGIMLLALLDLFLAIGQDLFLGILGRVQILEESVGIRSALCCAVVGRQA
jgi:hypothetical protein